MTMEKKGKYRKGFRFIFNMTSTWNWVIASKPVWLWLPLWLVVMALIESTEAYPTLVMPRIYRPIQRLMDDGKRIELGLPQTDDDVLQLEHLRQVYKDENNYYDSKQHHYQQKKNQIITDVVNDGNNDEIPSVVATVAENSNDQIETDQQVETAVTETASVSVPSATSVESPKETQTIKVDQGTVTTGIHRPPHLPIHDGGKTINNDANGANSTNDKAKAAAKCRAGMHGAARLMYGQNPEVLPTFGPSTPTSIEPALTMVSNTTLINTTSSAEITSLSTEREQEHEEEKEMDNKAKEIPTSDIVQVIDNDKDNDKHKESTDSQTEINDEQRTTVPTTTTTSTMVTSIVSQSVPQLHPMRPLKMDRKPQKEEEPPRQLIGDVITEESTLKKPASRRSIPNMGTTMNPKTAESLLKRANGGQYSSFDMAQYIFWTGDESGVAHAVDELIQNNMMTREEALKFLHEIRVGLEYLQKSYTNRVFPQEIHHNTIKKSYMPQTTATTTTTASKTTTEEPVIPYIIDVEQNLDESDLSNLGKTLQSIALWHKIQALHQNDKRSDLNSLNDNTDTKNIKTTNCENKEYNLEEIIYKLARIMFVQSLSHGSEESQREIEKLMDFLERERELGVITISMERKVLHVLLQALSDTLTEKPELWSTAQYLYKRLLHKNTHVNYNDNINI